MKKEEREIVSWDCEGTDTLYHTDCGDAIEAYLSDTPNEWWPETLEVRGYARMTVTIKEGSALDFVLEQLDEIYGGPDGPVEDATEKMHEAEKEFLDVVAAEYTPWVCEPVEKVTVNVLEWVKKNRPEWLEEEG